MVEVIPVKRQPVPVGFDVKVGRKGARVLSKHKPTPPIESAFWKGKEHWRLALADLCDSYDQICAFAAIRIERVTGARSVEHFKPKSKHPHLAYEWENFRLVCGLMNGRKLDYEDVLDPFEIPPHTFDINPFSGAIHVHSKCPLGIRGEAQATIDRLKLDDAECRRVRCDHIQKLFDHDWTLAETRRQSPFVVACLEEQGLI